MGRGVRGAYRSRAYGQSGKTRAQLASNRLLNTSSDCESITSCGSLFQGETNRTVKECALAAVSAVGFSNVRECPLPLHGSLRVKNLAGSRRNFPFKILNTQIRSSHRRRLHMEKSHRIARRTSYENILIAATSLVALRWMWVGNGAPAWSGRLRFSLS